MESERKALQKKYANFDSVQRMVKNGLGWSSHSCVIHGRVKDIALSAMMANNPGVTLNSAEIEFTTPFTPLVQRWEELKAYHDTTDGHQGKTNIFALIAVLNSALSSSVDDHSRLRESGKAGFNSLGAVFCPGEIMLARDGETISAYRLTSFTLEYAGHVAKQNYADVVIPQYDGERPVSSLPVYPAKGATGHQTGFNRVMARVTEQPEPEVNSLTDEKCMITSPYVKGMDLRNKEWYALRVEDLSGIGWNSHVFSSLFLQEREKETALSMVKHKNPANVDVDFLEGKEAGAYYTLEPKLIIPYSDLTVDARKVVWTNFFPHNGAVERLDLSAIEPAILAEAQVNGREIKNLVKNELIMNVEEGWQSGFGDPMRLGGYAFQHRDN
ncbi:hypothetical protein DL767_004483 [Monosporascus sp. MG133]|nr:hypothetical protein DL767_004483 [Monosporascus sp. MG133]